MPELTRSPALLWGVYFGIDIGGRVVLVSNLKYGFSLALLLLGLVLTVVFTIAGFLASDVRPDFPQRPDLTRR